MVTVVLLNYFTQPVQLLLVYTHELVDVGLLLFLRLTFVSLLVLLHIAHLGFELFFHPLNLVVLAALDGVDMQVLLLGLALKEKCTFGLLKFGLLLADFG